MARLMLSAGMLAARAASVAALRRTLPLGSPPPFRAATVISRRILEKSFPRCTSVLPFFRLICDHRECPDMAPSPSSVDRRFREMRGERQHPLAAGRLLGVDPHPDLERALPDILHLGAQHRDLAHLDRAEEIDVVHGPSTTLPRATPDAAM